MGIDVFRVINTVWILHKIVNLRVGAALVSLRISRTSRLHSTLAISTIISATRSTERRRRKEECSNFISVPYIAARNVGYSGTRLHLAQ